MKIIVFAMYRLVDLLLDGFLIFTGRSFRMVGLWPFSSSMLLDRSCAAPTQRWQRLGKDRKDGHLELMTVCAGSALALAGLRREDVCSTTKRFVLINRSDCLDGGPIIRFGRTGRRLGTQRPARGQR